MTHPQRILILLMVAAIPAAAPPLPGSSPVLCFAVGSLTYQVVRKTAAADLRVRIDDRAARPDVRMQLVDSIESADFAVVDDIGAAPSGTCSTLGSIKTVRTVADGDPADIIVSLSRDDADAGLKIYVHSLRFGHRDAAALFAAMRHYERSGKTGAEAEGDAGQHSW